MLELPTDMTLCFHFHTGTGEVTEMISLRKYAYNNIIACKLYGHVPRYYDSACGKRFGKAYGNCIDAIHMQGAGSSEC